MLKSCSSESLKIKYKPDKLNLIKCACSECGSFQISFEDEYTSAFRNYEPETISFIGRKIIQDHIAYSIEKKLYGDLY